MKPFLLKFSILLLCILSILVVVRVEAQETYKKDSIEFTVIRNTTIEVAFENNQPTKTQDNIYFYIDSFKYIIYIPKSGYECIGKSLYNTYILSVFFEHLSFIRTHIDYY